MGNEPFSASNDVTVFLGQGNDTLLSGFDGGLLVDAAAHATADCNGDGTADLVGI